VRSAAKPRRTRARIVVWGKASRTGRSFVAPEGNFRQRAGGQRRGGQAADEAAPLRDRIKPLKGEPWTWQRGETNPQGQARHNPSRTCETSRAEPRGVVASWMLRRAEVAKRAETPRKAPGKEAGQAGSRSTLKRRGMKSSG
jgi:hypothetical protein